MTTGPGFQPAGEDRFVVTGALSFETVPTVWEQSRSALEGAAGPVIDLGGVTEIDSAGLALVIEWLRTARTTGRRLIFTGVPDKLHALARISEVEAFLDGAATHSSSSSNSSS